MKKVLLLSTGGTIAAVLGDDGLVPALRADELVDLVPELAGICAVECRSILNLDSTNMGPDDWKFIATSIMDDLDLYDGIVVSHGTDTMAFTASMLSFMLVNVDKPVVLTGSQVPLVEPGSDGRRNIVDAFSVAASGRPGVFVVFSGKVIKGCRAVKVHSARLDAFSSVNQAEAGRVEGATVSFRDPPRPAAGPKRLEVAMDDRVFLLKLVPGVDAGIVDYLREKGYRGIVIEGFGAGGVPNSRQDLLKAIRRAVDSGVTVCITTQCLYDGCDIGIYDVGIAAGRAGAVSTFDMTPEAVVTKLMWVLGHTGDPEAIQRMMLENYCGEIDMGFRSRLTAIMRGPV
ncbi:MAG: L-asparaginase 1 [Spirochaetae bacterium HGW-Spirochaetae-7]|jgi:L-asparaginase|nr:MAG: L-asparaginase 1 [Spirochaetae bacterium HGW-Spirochaetae-7]